MKERPEAAPKPEWRASWAGKVIYINPMLTARTVELLDENGRVLAHVYGVHRIDISDAVPAVEI